MIAPDSAPAGQQGSVQFLATGVSSTGAHSTGCPDGGPGHANANAAGREPRRRWRE